MKTYCFAVITGLVFLAIAGQALAAYIPAEEINKAIWQYLQPRGYSATPVWVITGLNREVIDANINGKAVRLVIDSGCTQSCLTSRCAQQLGLEVKAVSTTGYSPNGKITELGAASITSFKIADHEINRSDRIMILPATDRVQFGGDGILGLPELELNGMIIPVNGHTLIFRTGHDSPVAIDSVMPSLGYKSIALSVTKAGLETDGRLNGRPFRCVIDLGANNSLFSVEFVRDATKQNGAPMQIPEMGIDGKHAWVYSFMPDSLEVGGQSIPPMRVYGIDQFSVAHLGIDALLGYDFLTEHQAVIDFGHNILWLK